MLIPLFTCTFTLTRTFLFCIIKRFLGIRAAFAAPQPSSLLLASPTVLHHSCQRAPHGALSTDSVAAPVDVCCGPETKHE